MNRPGARHVGEPRVLGDAGLGDAGRCACLYAAAMVTKHAPAFAAIAAQFEATFVPPATILLSRPDDPDGVTITYTIPAALLAATPHENLRQSEFAE